MAIEDDILNDNKKDKEDKEDKKDKILVKKSVLDAILEKMAGLEKSNEMLMYAADKSRLARYQDSLGVNITHKVRIRIYKDQLVIGWGRLVEDTVEKDGNGRWIERQIIKVFTEDEQSYDMLYRDFTKMVKVEAEIQAKTEKQMTPEEEELFNQEGKKLFYTLKVITKGPFLGKEITLAENYINS